MCLSIRILLSSWLTCEDENSNIWPSTLYHTITGPSWNNGLSTEEEHSKVAFSDVDWFIIGWPKKESLPSVVQSPPCRMVQSYWWNRIRYMYVLLPSVLTWGFEWGIYFRNVCAYICVCHAQECQFALTVCTHVHAQKLVHHVHWRWRSRTGKDGGSWQWRTRRTVRLILCNVHVLRSWMLNTADGWRHWARESNDVNVQKKPRR